LFGIKFLFLEVEEIIWMSAQPLFAGGVLHGGEDAVDGDGPDAVLRVGEVRADLREERKRVFFCFS
jgi:hypothetical protein